MPFSPFLFCHKQKIEEKELINKYYDNLPAKDRSVIYYKIIEELSFEEMGAKLDEKETTLRSRYKRALDKLKRMIGNNYN
ncbi:RNA polymerase sigma factor [Natranaerofaba carboxydovora]|uniref:RNA polymerase sigma factor n=1 Tax=Natranaerofaba carboxydovora TaxID=2742683 RepID=UPI001F146F69|nr:sigma factor-like helix-turn-helix DNA-binding protein [Natranaerofaba carboxydovora]UMZ72978.1 Sigma-70, region 4 [Natranaerofaba carboxydovora]